MTTLKVLSIPEPCCAAQDDVRRCAAIAAQGGVDITVLLPKGAEGYGSGSHGLSVLTLPVRRSLAALTSPNPRGAMYPSLGSVLRRIRPDVIHINTSPYSALAHAVVQLRGGASLVLEYEDQIPSPKFLPGWAMRLAERRALRAADFVLVRHYDVLSRARARGFSGPGAIVAYGMNSISPPPGAMRMSHAPGLALGYIGALSRDSGVVELVEAVTASRAPLSLVILGHGPLQGELNDRIAALRAGDRISLINATPDTQEEILRTIDVAVLTVQQAGCRPVDRRIADMHALGVPVIAFGIPGGRELVGDAGWYVTEGDAGLLSFLLRRLAAHPEEVSHARAACIPHVQWRASLDVVGAELARAFVRARQLQAGTGVVADVSLAASQGMKL